MVENADFRLAGLLRQADDDAVVGVTNSRFFVKVECIGNQVLEHEHEVIGITKQFAVASNFDAKSLVFIVNTVIGWLQGGYHGIGIIH